MKIIDLYAERKNPLVDRDEIFANNLIKILFAEDRLENITSIPNWEKERIRTIFEYFSNKDNKNRSLLDMNNNYFQEIVGYVNDLYKKENPVVEEKDNSYVVSLLEKARSKRKGGKK